jgi:hypothetical protein
MYVALLGLVCIVYAQLLPKQAKPPMGGVSGDMMKELEQSMEMFATDMEEQNQTLLQLFSETKRDYEGHLAKLSGRLEQLEEKNALLVKELTKAQPAPLEHTVIAPSAVPHIAAQHGGSSPGETESAQVSSEPATEYGEAVQLRNVVEAFRQAEQSAAHVDVLEETHRAPLLLGVRARYAELFQLHEQNKSVEHIAKKLNMNKGEVQLILQLAKQEEQAHA